ncbi:hypothetical protein CSUI_008932 [Cystoisospora suis]|uniref:Uncharacterized protein n=1 Tax=Cystoisospora suis TaxID=483139 RepID=A0A2C6KL92_9APIC|nr:hypothetical protein CSUI_008932 [Cystoisospora suis]
MLVSSMHGDLFRVGGASDSPHQGSAYESASRQIVLGRSSLFHIEGRTPSKVKTHGKSLPVGVPRQSGGGCRMLESFSRCQRVLTQRTLPLWRECFTGGGAERIRIGCLLSVHLTGEV